ncbi:hypothetical protein Trad_2881 [Truepera radiovictrix DSM 17093]|uniref:DUF2905 domain-containing protein n=2 Tax=Truepera TaxID=332248 RepID=D7CVR8_TRURR|nr:hypothetical protein Trad_2881 [Truepera radiovictrix DSM 17093]
MRAPGARYPKGMARLLIALGLFLLVAGVALALFPRAFSWFGTLPGDLRIRRDGVSIFIPITSALLLSGALTLVINLIAWFLRR